MSAPLQKQLRSEDEIRALAWRIRRHVVEMCSRGGSSHVGSALSMTDIIATLYGGFLEHDPIQPLHTMRDRCIVSKGHAGACVYAALAECGYFPLQRLADHYQDGTLMSGHISHALPGVELSTGSLGMGLSVGVGRALAGRQVNASWQTVVVMSDGECDEGSNWEAAMFAAHHRLDRLIAIIDYNKLQSLCSVEETLALEPFADKWTAFGWTVERCDGHAIPQILDALNSDPHGRPKVIIADTIKGRGINFMEHQVLWHYRSPKGDEYQAAVAALESHRPQHCAPWVSWAPATHGADATHA